MVAIRQPKNTLLAKHTIRARLKYSVGRTLTLPLKVPRRGEKGAAFAGEMSGFTFGYYSLSPVLKSGPAAINAVLYLAKEVYKSPFISTIMSMVFILGTNSRPGARLTYLILSQQSSL